jgi:glutathione S-transferase
MAPPKYELYYNPFSICSLMVLYTLRLKGQPKSPADAVDPDERFIDIYAGEQMTESYLEKHPKGTVSTLST